MQNNSINNIRKKKIYKLIQDSRKYFIFLCTINFILLTLNIISCKSFIHNLLLCMLCIFIIIIVNIFKINYQQGGTTMFEKPWSFFSLSEIGGIKYIHFVIIGFVITILLTILVIVLLQSLFPDTSNDTKFKKDTINLSPLKVLPNNKKSTHDDYNNSSIPENVKNNYFDLYTFLIPPIIDKTDCIRKTGIIDFDGSKGVSGPQVQTIPQVQTVPQIQPEQRAGLLNLNLPNNNVGSLYDRRLQIDTLNVIKENFLTTSQIRNKVRKYFNYILDKKSGAYLISFKLNQKNFYNSLFRYLLI